MRCYGEDILILAVVLYYFGYFGYFFSYLCIFACTGYYGLVVDFKTTHYVASNGTRWALCLLSKLQEE